VILRNHPNTIEELLLTVRYTRGEGSRLKATAQNGVPQRLHCKNIIGACPSELKPYRVREARNMQADPLLIAEVVTTALIIEGRTLIPASWKAMTNGDC